MAVLRLPFSFINRSYIYVSSKRVKLFIPFIKRNVELVGSSSNALDELQATDFLTTGTGHRGQHDHRVAERLI